MYFMRFAAILAAGVGAALPSWAQVTLSGTIDLIVRRDSGMAGKAMYALSPGGSRSSRLTFSAREDLGGGLVAHVVLESGLAADVGTAGANAAFFSRVATVNLGSDATGYISFGRQYTPLQDVSASGSSDPFGGAWLGGTNTVFSKTINTNNGIVYHYGLGSSGTVGPVPVTGLGVVALVAPGEAATQTGGVPAQGSAGNQFGLGASYGYGPVWVGAAYHNVKGSSDTGLNSPNLKQSYAGVAYDFGFARFHLGWNRGLNDAVGTTQLSRVARVFGITAPAGELGTFRFLYGKADDRTAYHRDFSTVQVAYLYNLSKRTALYVNAAQVDNSATSSQSLSNFTVSSVPAGAKVRTLAAGMRHSF